MRFKKHLILLCCVLLTSCGFHLQGSEPIPAALQTLYLTSETPYSSFMHLLRQNLKQRHVTVVDAPNDAPVTLTVNGANISTSETSVATSQQTRQYEVTYTATFVLTDSKTGKIIMPSFSPSAKQPQTMLEGQLLENTSQLHQLEPVLQRQVISQFFSRLQSIGMKKALATYENQS